MTKRTNLRRAHGGGEPPRSRGALGTRPPAEERP